MTGASVASASTRPDAHASDDWVVSIALDAPASLGSAIPVERHGHLQGFLAGLLTAGDESNDARRHSDAAIALRAFARGGERGLAALRGHFVCAILDASDRRAIVARDPLGARPLFFAQAAGLVHFATHPRHLLGLPGVSRALNRGALADRLCHRWPHREETFFAAVRRVPPGWLVEIGHGRAQARRYWDPAPHGRVAWLDDAEAARFDALFDQSIDRCLGTGNTGVFLSGGLDSISVAAVATDRASRIGVSAPLALSLAFPDPRCDERHVQRAVARGLGIRQHLVDFFDAVGDRGLLAQSLDLNAHLASPVLNTWGPAYHALMRRGHVDGVQTILTGMGGDEWLTVSPLLSADMLSRGDFAGTYRYLRAMLRSHTLGPARITKNVLWTFGLRPLASRTLHRLAPVWWHRSRVGRQVRHDPAWVAPDPSLRRELVDRAHHNLGPADPGGGFYLNELRTSLDHSLVSWEFEEQYEFGARLGTRLMHPFWDADLVDLMFRLRPSALSRDGRSKSLVRETLARRFPALGFDRQRKLSGTQFYRAIIEKEGPRLLDAIGGFDALHDLGVVSGPDAFASARRALAQPPRAWSQVWNLANLEAWARAHAS